MRRRMRQLMRSPRASSRTGWPPGTTIRPLSFFLSLSLSHTHTHTYTQHTHTHTHIHTRNKHTHTRTHISQLWDLWQAPCGRFHAADSPRRRARSGYEPPARAFGTVNFTLLLSGFRSVLKLASWVCGTNQLTIGCVGARAQVTSLDYQL